MGRSYKSTRTAKARGLELLRLSSCIRWYPFPYIRKRIYGLVGSEVKWPVSGMRRCRVRIAAHGLSFLRITMVARSRSGRRPTSEAMFGAATVMGQRPHADKANGTDRAHPAARDAVRRRAGLDQTKMLR